MRQSPTASTKQVTTDLSASPETRSGSGFTVMDAPTS